MIKLDITLVCGRRPDLLSQTLAALRDKVLCNFQVGTIYANIDPFCGNIEDGDKCEDMLYQSFPLVKVTRPETASFGAAVKYLWQQPQTDFFLHMEDDWDILYPISPEDIVPRFKNNVVQVQLASRDKLYLPKTYSFKASWRKTFGLKVLKKIHTDRPLFGTSPSFIRTDFANACADRMDPGKDPEKQLYAPGTELGDFTRDFLNHPLQAPDRKAIVRDLGRDWLIKKGVKKRIVEGVSIWEDI